MFLLQVPSACPPPGPFLVSLHVTSIARPWKGGKDMSGDRGTGAVPCHPLPTCSLTHVAVVIDGAGLASLQLPLDQVDQVLGVIGFFDLLLSGRQDLAWGGEQEGMDGGEVADRDLGWDFRSLVQGREACRGWWNGI